MSLEHKTKGFTLPLLCLLLLLPGTAWSLKSDIDQPIYVEADSIDIDDANKRSIYRGNVVITQGTIRLTGKKVTVLQKKGNGESFVAEGSPARFRQEIEGKRGKFVKGSGKICKYDSNGKLLYLIGNATLTQEGDTFRSDRIIYDRERSLIKGGAAAKGKRRVRIKIKSSSQN